MGIWTWTISSTSLIKKCLFCHQPPLSVMCQMLFRRLSSNYNIKPIQVFPKMWPQFSLGNLAVDELDPGLPFLRVVSQRMTQLECIVRRSYFVQGPH
ncbi:uncharacterized protein LOC107739874 isoform X1 [Tachysurus ichikawai]